MATPSASENMNSSAPPKAPMGVQRPKITAARAMNPRLAVMPFWNEALNSSVRQAPEGIFVDTKQRFAVNGVEFLYRHRALRYLDFLVPQADLVSLPLFQRAQVRVTYCGEGEDKRLLRFEIATSALDANDWPAPETAALSN